MTALTTKPYVAVLIPEAINWATETALADFLERHLAAPLDELAATLRAICNAGFGTWQSPATLGDSRPATHLYEISLWSVLGTGPTAIEAARSWRIAAARLFDLDAILPL